MMNILLLSMIIWSMILLTLNHPLSMGFILIMQTISMAMIVGFMTKSFFFSYIIIIIIMSGMLVLFIYMSSVASNEKFNSPIKNIIMFFLMSMIMLYILLKYNMNSIPNYLDKNETMSLIKMFNSMTAQITIMLIIYLFITMIVVSNVAKTNFGPLRMKS
uniref:NADH-ubiquinone oxidoreductase chain 6 n=1 Tax=Halyomorpha halys TaxID=286706 RepID=A0A7G1PUN6_HALHY|nr:NADH dehydrogenase subunit 6 [Halyomorpha halys]